MSKAIQVRFIGIFLTKVDDGVSVDVGDDSYVIKAEDEKKQIIQMNAMAGQFQLDMERHNKEHAGESIAAWLVVMPDPDTRIYIKPRHIPYHWDLPTGFLDEYGLVELADISRVKGIEAKNALIKDFNVVELDIIYDEPSDTTASLDEDGRLVADGPSDKD
jgi:hypothetical protein